MIDWFFQKNSNFTKLFKKYLIQQLKYSQSFFREKNKHVSSANSLIKLYVKPTGKDWATRKRVAVYCVFY